MGCVFLMTRRAPRYTQGGSSAASDVYKRQGQGHAHSRRLGLASHLGLFLNKPVIGCAKSRLIGTYKEPGLKKASTTRLYDRSEVVGAVVRLVYGDGYPVLDRALPALQPVIPLERSDLAALLGNFVSASSVPVGSVGFLGLPLQQQRTRGGQPAAAQQRGCCEPERLVRRGDADRRAQQLQLLLQRGVGFHRRGLVDQRQLALVGLTAQFGDAAGAAKLLPAGETVERDRAAIRILTREMPKAGPAPELSAERPAELPLESTPAPEPVPAPSAASPENTALSAVVGPLPDALPPNLAKLWQEGLQQSYLATSTVFGTQGDPLPKRLERAYTQSFARVSLAYNQQATLLAWCLEVAQKRTHAIVGGQHRKSYDKAAILTVACAEVLQLRGVAFSDGGVYTAYASGLVADGSADRTLYLGDEDRFRVDASFPDFAGHSGVAGSSTPPRGPGSSGSSRRRTSSF